MIKTLRFTKRLSLLFIAIAVAFSQSTVLAQDSRIRDLQFPYYDPDYVDVCDPNAISGQQTVGNGDSVYILGDSITVRTEPSYKQLLDEARGITTYINGSVGRSWTGEGTDTTPQGTTQSGEAAALLDREQIEAANGIVIALGSNGGLGSNPIDDVISRIRTYNSDAPIWWINTIYTADWQNASDLLGRFNAELQSNQWENVSVIDWFRTVDPAGNPEITPANDPSNLLEDGIHPTAAGQLALAGLVVEELTGGVGTTISTATGGTFSADVWGTSKTLQPEWIPILDRAGQRFGVDPAVLAALLSIETGWDSPDSFSTNPRRNSATATGPFQFIDSTAVSYMPAPDQWAANTGANYNSATIKQLNNGTELEPDGTYVVDGDKDGRVDRATPEDAALMAAAYMKTLGINSDTILGDENDYRVPRSSEANPMTVRLAGAYYNQGQGWSAPNATTEDEVNALARGNNDVAHYMDQMWDVTKAGRESGVFGGNFGGDCVGVRNPATGNAAEYIADCGANNGNAQIACIAINQLQGIPYSNPQRAAPDNPNPEFLDCSAMVNMAVYRAFGNAMQICSAQFLTNSNYEIIDVRDIQPGDIVGKGSICGEDSAGVTGHVAIVVSYDVSARKLITVETASERYLSGLRGIGGEDTYNVGLEVDGNGSYSWAVRYVGPK